MKHRTAFFFLWLAMLSAFVVSISARRHSQTLRGGWQFSLGGVATAQWQDVDVPHDWAIYGPFDVKNDTQFVAVEQDGETVPHLRTGRTGGLPIAGKGAYRTTIHIPDTCGRSFTLLFDGAMSNSKVTVNGRLAIEWPNGYNSFHVCIDKFVRPGSNDILVELENRNHSSRWYPGAGLYRNVHLIATDKVHFPLWEARVTTPKVTDSYAQVSVCRGIAGLAKGQKAVVSTIILDGDGRRVAGGQHEFVNHGQQYRTNIIVDNPRLWSPDSPYLYRAVSTIAVDGRTVDADTVRFGIRTIEYVAEKGFFLNGKPEKFRGVCNHHDLGPLGAAVNRKALRHQIEMLKDMGANAIRTSHNMPAPELVELCDEMGMMMMVEAFDDWSYRPKSYNGYGAVFSQWWERDICNMVKHYCNSPSVMMWSIGNEVNDQKSPDCLSALWPLQELVHRLDPTRPVTCGMNHLNSTLENGFAAALDIPGYNYKPQSYDRIHSLLPQGIVLGSETASTVSSRGKYFFPLEWRGKQFVKHEGNHSSSYDNECCWWSNTPDDDFAMDDDCEWMIGQFVWTGFDYLGEPTPYSVDCWPSHSSYFGIIDLASIPKDRYWLYRSQWNKRDHTLHILPHWNWKGREGQVTPVFVYTDYPKAELFVNGVSQGVREKNKSTVRNRYRLMWDEVCYQPGELKVVAYDAAGKAVAEKTVRTAGRPHHLVLSTPHTVIAADGEDLAYVMVTVADKDGNPCPTDSREVKFRVTGAGSYRAAANGDPTCLSLFHEPRMPLFSGALTAIVQSGTEPGAIVLEAVAKGVKPAKIEIKSVAK